MLLILRLSVQQWYVTGSCPPVFRAALLDKQQWHPFRYQTETR